jgi:hypothetical protein
MNSFVRRPPRRRPDQRSGGGMRRSSNGGFRTNRSQNIEHSFNNNVNNGYRNISRYDFNTDVSQVDSFEFIGLYKGVKDYNQLIKELKTNVMQSLTFDLVIDIFDLKNVTTGDNVDDVAIKLYYAIDKVLNKKLDDIGNLNSIKDFEEIRDNIIKTLDKLNYITKNGSDVKLENGVSSSVNLTSFVNVDFYQEYSGCIDYIKRNQTTMDEKINKDILDANQTLTDEVLTQFILGTILNDDKDMLMNDVKQIFEITDEFIDIMDKHLDSILKNSKTYNLRYGKKPKRKNGKPIVFNIGNETVTTTTPEIKQIFATTNDVTERLNYYKK